MELLELRQASELVGISVETILQWEKRGFLRTRKDEDNQRIYKRSELSQLRDKLSKDSVSAGFNVLKCDSNQHSVIELFAGAGGLALGFENAGFSTDLLVEIDRDASETLKANRPEWKVLQQDVCGVDFTPYYGIDAVSGGFPCQPFSYTGLRRGFEDTRGTLFFEFARCIRETKPKIVVAENVKGLVNHDKGRTLETILAAFRELGYRTQHQILSSQFYDVAQKRDRLFIVALREDLKAIFHFPEGNDYILTLRDALAGCPDSNGASYPEWKRNILSHVPPGGNWRDLPEPLQIQYMKGSLKLSGGKTGHAKRLAWNEPSLTLTCNPIQTQTERCHPEETRPLTTREYARIQSFPDDWVFCGSTSSQYKQIGNAVPVNLGFHIALSIAKTLTHEKSPA